MSRPSRRSATCPTPSPWSTSIRVAPPTPQIVGGVDMPQSGDELHHYGWNACSSCLCPNAPHPHVERRYLVVPGLRSSRIYIIDTKPDPKNPKIVKVIEPEEMIEATGYSRPHTVHCGPDGIYVSALGNAEGRGARRHVPDGSETFDVLGRWEVDRGPQQLAYDAWWHLGYDTMVTSEWGTPEHDRERARCRRSCSARIWPAAAFLGPAQAQASAGDRFRPGVSARVRAAARRTIRPRPTASSIA